MRISRFLILAVGIGLVVTTVFAHHGTGVSYAASNPVTLKGTVTEFRYANPHPQLYFDVTDEKGNVVHWSGEFYPNPAQLIQGGWGRKRSEAALQFGTILTLLNEKGEAIMGVAGGGPGEAPRGGAPAPAAGAVKP